MHATSNYFKDEIPNIYFTVFPLTIFIFKYESEWRVLKRRYRTIYNFRVYEWAAPAACLKK